MKRKIFPVLMILTALVSLLIFIVPQNQSELMSQAMVYPYGPIAALIRTLSLQGGGGNVLAWFIFLLIGTIPLVVFIWISRQRPVETEDFLLLLMIPLLFYVLYRLINPQATTINHLFGSVYLAGILHSVVIGYFILLIIRYFRRADSHQLHHYMVRLLQCLILICLFTLFGPSVNNLLAELRSFQAANTMPEQYLTSTIVIIIGKHLIQALPLILIIWIIYRMINLVNELDQANYNKAARMAGQLADLAGRVLLITVSVNIGFNLLQLMLQDSLLSTHVSVDLRLDLILLFVGSLLFSRFVENTQKLKADNDLFV
ncbi:MAG: hypothetical protein WAV55_08960 [Clostridiaceae bacterium]